jgi:hypothetical protein
MLAVFVVGIVLLMVTKTMSVGLGVILLLLALISR